MGSFYTPRHRLRRVPIYPAIAASEGGGGPPGYGGRNGRDRRPPPVRFSYRPFTAAKGYLVHGGVGIKIDRAFIPLKCEGQGGQTGGVGCHLKGFTGKGCRQGRIRHFRRQRKGQGGQLPF